MKRLTSSMGSRNVRFVARNRTPSFSTCFDNPRAVEINSRASSSKSATLWVRLFTSTTLLLLLLPLKELLSRCRWYASFSIILYCKSALKTMAPHTATSGSDNQLYGVSFRGSTGTTCRIYHISLYMKRKAKSSFWLLRKSWSCRVMIPAICTDQTNALDHTNSVCI